MSVDRSPELHMIAPLAHRVPEGSAPAAVASAMGVVWAELDATLSPILGPRGVAALWQRSLHLAAAAHPWLSAGQPDGGPPDAAALVAALGGRGRDDAVAGSNRLLATFHELLVSLIGASLTERLLRSVWGPASGAPGRGPTAQDPTT